MGEERTPPEVREGVRTGILASIRQDVEQRGSRTARFLLAAGVVGVIGAIGATLLLSGHPYDHHPPWHVTVFTTVWAGLLFVSFAIALLQVRTPSLPLARSATVGILGLGLAGICGALCPDQHFLHWWSATSVGQALTETAGLALSALCFGFVTTLVFGRPPFSRCCWLPAWRFSRSEPPRGSSSAGSWEAAQAPTWAWRVRFMSVHSLPVPRRNRSRQGDGRFAHRATTMTAPSVRGPARAAREPGDPRSRSHWSRGERCSW